MTTLPQRITAIIKRKKQEQLSNDFISSDSHDKQPIKDCTDKLFKLIVKLQESKSKQRKQSPIQIRKRIYIGNYMFSSDQKFIRSSNIGLIISCLSTSPIINFENIKYEKIKIKDQQGQDMLQFSQRIYELIQNHIQNQVSNIYIHCFHGKSRSVAILLMYLMRKQGIQLNQLLKQMKQKYPIAQPNRWFIQQLKSYQSTTNNIMFSSDMKSKLDSNTKQQDHDLLGFNNMEPLQFTQLQLSKQEKLLIQNSNLNNKINKYRQHLLIPDNEKTKQNKKNNQQYHLIQIDDDQLTIQLI